MPNLKNKTKFNGSSIPKNVGWLEKYGDGGETDPPSGLKNNQWMGANLNKEGYITSETKGGNRISFTGNQKADELFNKQIDSGKFNFDPKTGGTFLLKKPVKGLSKEDQFIATKEYHDLRAPKGFTNESQKEQIAKLPKFQQDIINAENEKRRKKVVSDSMQEVGKHPLFYAPGIIGAAPFAVAGLSEAGMASAPYIQGALSTQLPGMANVSGATVGNAITAGFAGHGAAHITPDAVEMYKNPSWSNAGSLLMDVAEVSPIIGPTSKVIGEGLNATLNTAKNAGKYLTEQTALKNAYKLNPYAFKPNPEAYYHRSPNLENIVNRETGTLQGFGNSKAGIEFSKDAGPGGTGNLFITTNGRVTKLNLKKPANSQLYFAKGVPLDFGRYNKVLNKKTGKLIDGQGYEGPYMVQVEGVPMGASTKGRAPGADVTNIGGYAVPRRPISLDEAKFYKEHWLKGYKKVPKKENGGWLDTYEDGGETDPPVNLRSASTQLASPVSTQAPEVPLNKTGWDWVKQKYENKQPSEWNMLMMDKSGSYVDSGVDPFSLMLTAPQQVIKAGVKGGKALLDASKNNKIKSEIDWSKWNKEIPDNTQLMKEYNTIEQTSKANGTWMKNPDGSKFEGTPEQFVQQNSSNFKKAFPGGASKTYRGITVHNHNLTDNYNSVFTADKAGASGYTRKGMENKYFNPNIPNIEEQISIGAKKYGMKEPVINKSYRADMMHSNEAGMHELYYTNKDKIIADFKNSDFNDIKKSDIPKELLKYLPNKKTYFTDDIAEALEKSNFSSLEIKNIIDPFYIERETIHNLNKSKLKSARGNNGMFDMTNPNIYKAAIPIGLGVAASQNKQDNSQWLEKYGL